MAVRILALCEACGKGYSARLVNEQIILPTNDGCCECGEQGFEVCTTGEVG